MIGGEKCGRYAHSTFVIQNIIYTVGGGDKGVGYVEDMIVYDPSMLKIC
jgi:hypothetical protein